MSAGAEEHGARSTELVAGDWQLMAGMKCWEAERAHNEKVGIEERKKLLKNTRNGSSKTAGTVRQKPAPSSDTLGHTRA